MDDEREKQERGTRESERAQREREMCKTGWVTRKKIQRRGSERRVREG